MKFMILFAEKFTRGPFKNSYEMFHYINEKTEHSAIFMQNTDGKEKLVKNKENEEGVYYLSFSKQLDELKKITESCDVILDYMMLHERMEDEFAIPYVEYMKFIDEKKIPHVYFQFCHGRSCEISKKYPEILKNLILVTFRDDIIWFDYFKRRNVELPKKNIFVDDDLAMVHGIDFNSYKRFWIPAKKKLEKSVKFIGQTTKFKGCWKLRDFHRDYLQKLGFISSMEGIANSIGMLNEIFKTDGDDWMKKREVRDDVLLKLTKRDSEELLKDQWKMQRNSPVYVFPHYAYEEGMRRLSESQFGFEWVQLPGLEGTVFENAMMEMIGVGTIPIFTTKWGKDFKIAGKPIIEYDHKEIGTIFIDEDNPDVSEIIKLSEDPKLYDEYRVNAFKFYKKWLDMNTVNEKLLSKIIKKIEEN